MIDSALQTEQNLSRSTALIRSFGRIKSRKLSPVKKTLLAELLPLYQIRDDDFGLVANQHYQNREGLNLLHSSVQKLGKNEDLRQSHFGNRVSDLSGQPIQGLDKLNQSQNHLEIGFGFGDFLCDIASKNLQHKFFGCEPHLNGVVNLLAKLQIEALDNLKISTTDIRLLLANFADEFFSKIFILFPDPWPKMKHFKRRLVTVDFLDNYLAPKLQKGGKLIIATDHDGYKTWILSHILRSKNFIWTAQTPADWQNFPQNWHKTKYQQKAENEGRNSIILELLRI